MTSYNKGYDQEKQLEIDPYLCMSGSNFLLPSKTVQLKSNNSPVISSYQSSSQLTKRKQENVKDKYSMNNTLYLSPTINSINTFNKNVGINLA